MLRVLYFAWVREKVGAGEETVDPPPDIATLGALADWLATTGSGHAEALSDRARLRAAVDGELVSLDAPFEGAREVAFFPPVTGG